MGENVWVESFDALKRLRTALCRFAEMVGSGLGEADAELQRERDWVKSDRANYWKLEGRKRAELLTKAKIALAGKKAETTPLGGHPSCVEEEKALARAKHRFEEAEQKLANVQHWRRRLDEEVFSYQGVANALSQTLIVDIPRALARLDNMLAALEAYAPSVAPQTQGSMAAGVAESVARPGLRESRDYAALRVRTPPPTMRDALPLVMLSADPQPRHPERLAAPATLVLPDVARVPVDAADRIVVARGIAEQPHIYLERLAPVASGDSGWYMGAVDDAATVEYDAVRIAAVLAARPEIAPLLELPPGYLAVFDKGELETVLDAENHCRWAIREEPAPQQPAVDPAEKREEP